MISLVDLFGLNPKQTRSKNYGKREMDPLLFLPLADSSQRGLDDGGGDEERSVVSCWGSDGVRVMIPQVSQDID